MPIDYDALIRRFDEAQNRANTANLERYQALLTHLETLGQQVGAQGTFGEAENLLAQVGTAARTRIAEQETRALAATEQGLISRGLGGTTIRATARRGVMSDAERARQEAEERTAQQKAGLLTQRAGVETQIGGMRAAAIEGRTDVGPDLGMFASLLQAAAAGDTAGGARRTATIMGPQAQAGRDVFGQPFSYGPSRAGGGGGGGAGIGGAGGGIGAQGATGQARYFPPGTYGGGPSLQATGATGTARVTPAQPTGAGDQVSLGGQGIVDLARQMAGPGAARIGMAPGAGAGDEAQRTWTPEQIQAPGGAEGLLGAAGISSGGEGQTQIEGPWEVTSLGNNRWRWRNRSSGVSQIRNTGTRGGGW